MYLSVHISKNHVSYTRMYLQTNTLCYTVLESYLLDNSLPVFSFVAKIDQKHI